MIIGGHTTHHGCPLLGKLILLVERVAFWGKIVHLYLLRVNLGRFLALGSIPLPRENTDSGYIQAYEGK
jgi:hypothetical protein